MIIKGNFMKTQNIVSIFVVLIGILALVQNVNATAYMDNDTWTGINSITDPFGYTYIKSTSIDAINSTKANKSVILASDYATIQAAINASYVAGGGIVEVSEGIHIINTIYGQVDATERVGLLIPENVTLRGQGAGATVIRQGTNLDSWVFVYLSGKNSGLKDITIDYNGFNQASSSSYLYAGAIQLGSQTASDKAQVKNVEIKNAVGRWMNATLTVIALNLYMAPYATVNNVWIDTFDAGILVTRAYDSTKTEYSISNIWAENGTAGAGFALHYETGNATVTNFYTNNSDPLHVLSGNPKIYNFISKHPKGDIRIGTDAATTGKYEGLDIDGNGITIVITSPSIDLINPIVKNSIGYGISVNSGGYANIINPSCTNVTNSCINFESNSHGTIIGGNLTQAQQNGLTINTGSSVDVNGIQISNTSLAGSNQFSGIVIAGASNNSTIRNSKIITNSLMRYSVEMTGGDNNILENNWLSFGINGYYVLSGSGSSATQNRNAAGYDHGNSATASIAFGVGDIYYNSTSFLQMISNSTSWNAFMTQDKFISGANVTITKNITDGTITIASTGGSGGVTMDEVNASAQITIPQVTNLQTQQDAQNTSINNLQFGEGSILFTNGSSNIAVGFIVQKRTMYNGNITALYADSIETGSINITVSNATLGTYKGSVIITSGNTGSSTGLNYTFTTGEMLNYTIISNTGIKQVTFTQRHTKTS